MTERRSIYLWLWSATALMVAGCDLAPDFQRPDLPAPPAYKESPPKNAADHAAANAAAKTDSTPDWQPAQLQAADSSKGPWWEAYHDPVLNQLQSQVTSANQNLEAAVARYDEASALARAARAALFPTVNGIAGYGRASSTTPAGATASTASGASTPPSMAGSTASASAASGTKLRNKERILGAELSYEFDVWGRVRNQVTAQAAEAAATKADLAAIALSLHAELANDYFTLRGADEAVSVLQKTIAAYQKAYDLTVRRFQGGVTAEADVDQAKTQLENARAQLADRALQRAQLEHAIAVLTGQPPASFAIVPAPFIAEPLVIRAGLPSTLLERRPDVAAVASRAAEANARIGVTRAAFFPLFNLNGTVGYETTVASALFDSSSFFWSLGSTAAVNIFDGGRLRALNDEAKATYNESAANYRQTTLTAYQEVEDSLAAEQLLAQAFDSQRQASDAADRALQQATYRFSGGIGTYLDVVVVQNIALTNALAANDIRTRRLSANIALIRALGGGWQPDADP